MGAWGPGLYSDDVTEDVRGIYVDKLHRGKNGEQASKEMIAEFIAKANRSLNGMAKSETAKNTAHYHQLQTYVKALEELLNENSVGLEAQIKNLFG